LQNKKDIVFTVYLSYMTVFIYFYMTQHYTIAQRTEHCYTQTIILN